MRVFTRQPQEREGTYTFTGTPVYTAGVGAMLDTREILYILFCVRADARESGGLDYLQVFAAEDGTRVWVMDALNADMKASGNYEAADDITTILLPSEH